jgi:hypothetical protein
MKIIQNRVAWIAVALMLLMAFTRMNHFGTAVYLPDASWAVFLLAGFFIASPRFLGALLVGAALVDYFAITVQGVNDYCFTPAYWFLIPTYAVLWFGGRYYARIHRDSLLSLGIGSGVAFIAVGAAFFISNLSFYLFAGYFEKMGLVEYALSVVQYFPSYLAVTLMYLIPAVLLDTLLTRRSDVAQSAANHAG